MAVRTHPQHTRLHSTAAVITHLKCDGFEVEAEKNRASFSVMLEIRKEDGESRRPPTQVKQQNINAIICLW